MSVVIVASILWVCEWRDVPGKLHVLVARDLHTTRHDRRTGVTGRQLTPKLPASRPGARGWIKYGATATTRLR